MALINGKKKELNNVWNFKSRAICVALFFLVLWVLVGVGYVSLSLFPETEMAFNSNCHNPLQNWDGKILDFPVWWSAFQTRPAYFNLHNEKDLSSDFSGHYCHSNKRTVVLWGTHHKTGTFLAKKLFAKVCSRMQWCCLFHVTRDSVHAVRSSLHLEPVNALGHNQWIWHPSELNITNYRFIHFYRDPFRKVVSGYRYHADGTEAWTQKPLAYNQVCQRAAHLQAIKSDDQNQLVDRKAVFEFCESVHLCETCCRREHEAETKLRAHAIEEGVKTFRYRGINEYNFLCANLGAVNQSIQHTLKHAEEKQGVVVEAALEYYEILRMATLYNQTIRDPHTLNLDLDYFTENFDEGTWRILHHLKDLVPSTLVESLHQELAFYNLETSPLYRWSMSNPIINHVTANQKSGMTTRELVQVLSSNPDVMSLYKPIYDLMTP
eukprot:gene9423-10408_t